MSQLLDNGSVFDEQSAAYDLDLDTTSGVPAVQGHSAAFYEATIKSSAALPQVTLTDKDGNPIEGEKIADAYLSFQIPKLADTQRIPIQGSRRPLVFPVLISYRFNQSGGHTSDDYWNVHLSFKVHALFIVAPTDKGFSHLLTIAAVPRNRIDAGGVNMRPRAEMIANLKEGEISDTVEAIRELDLNGRTFDTIEKAFDSLDTCPGYMVVEASPSYSL